jgi:SAM-dependent methyltransferase
MDPRHLDELAALEDTYWWHVGKRQLVLKLLQDLCPPPARVVEGGVGGCGNLSAFQRAGYEVSGLDILADAARYGQRRGVASVICHDLSQPWPLPEAGADVVVLLDVLEHTADPALVLRHARRVLTASGSIVVTVPAYPWLYGPWDKQLGHYRRYTAERLREDADGAGFRVQWLSHWNVFSLPPAVATRLWQRCRVSSSRGEFPRVSPLTNRLLIGLAAIERWWLARCRLPLGLSLVGVLVP